MPALYPGKLPATFRNSDGQTDKQTDHNVEVCYADKEGDQQQQCSPRLASKPLPDQARLTTLLPQLMRQPPSQALLA